MNPWIRRSLIEWTKTAASVGRIREVVRLRHLTREEYANLQLQRLRETYRDAVAHVPYYASRPEEYPPDLFERPSSSVGSLESLPILAKATVRDAPEEFWRRPFLFGSTLHATGGTTGSPLQVRAGLRERGLTEAILRDRDREITGSATSRVLRLSGMVASATLDNTLVRIPATRYAYLSIYSLRESHARGIVEEVRRFSPQMLHGYSSALSEFARMLLAVEETVPSLRAAVATSETLFDEQRETISRALGVPTYSEYGSQEGQHLLLECTEGSMHVHPLRGVVEIQDSPGGEKQFIVTGLMARSMPLFRYAIGDSAVEGFLAGDCRCGLSWPRTGQILGRTEDLVLTREGRRIGLLAHSTLKDTVGVRECQLVQRDYERFEVRVVTRQGFEKDDFERHVRDELSTRIGTRLHVSFLYPDHIPRSPSGKFKAVAVEFEIDGPP